MILELSVIFACTSGYCPVVSSAYFAQNPKIINQAEEIKNNVAQKLGYKLATYTASIVGIAIQKEATVDLGKRKSLTFGTKNDTIGVKFTYGF